MATVLETQQKYAVAYLRVSTSLQDCANQRREIQNYADEQKFELRAVFQDPATSGKTDPMRRPGFSAMMQFIQANPVSCIYVYSISRIGRDMLATLETIRNAEKIAPIVPVAASEHMLQSLNRSFRAYMMATLGFVADLERQMIAERTRSGMARRKAEGQKFGRPKKQLDKERILTLLACRVPRYKVANDAKCSKAVLYANLRAWGVTVHDYRKKASS